jgi:hypothetical protein
LKESSSAEPQTLADLLLARRIVLVTGKGGTGRTTLCCALGLAAARRGLRSVIVEMNGARRVAPVFGKPSLGYQPQDLAEDLSTLSITPLEAIEDYITLQLKSHAVFRLVFRNRVTGPFLDAVPGLPVLIQLGKVFDMSREKARGRLRYDFIIVDGPATGHGLTMLDSAQAMMETTRSGPLYRNARLVRDLFHDPALTAILLGTLPETLPVNEVLDFYGGLGARTGQVAGCVVNEMWPSSPYPGLEQWEPAQARLRNRLPAGGLSVVDFLDRWVRRDLLQQRLVARLEATLHCPVAPVPYLFLREVRPEQLGVFEKALQSAPARRPDTRGDV